MIFKNIRNIVKYPIFHPFRSIYVQYPKYHPPSILSAKPLIQTMNNYCDLTYKDIENDIERQDYFRTCMFKDSYII